MRVRTWWRRRRSFISNRWMLRRQSKPSTRSNRLIPSLHYDAAFPLLKRQTVTSRPAVHTERVSLFLRNQEFSGRWEHGSHFAIKISAFWDSSKASLIFNRFFQYANSQDSQDM
jgi:hypothetical protein